MRFRDILRLALLRSAADLNHKPIAVFAEVNAIAGSEIDLVFKDPAAHAFDVGEIALLHSRQGRGHARRGVVVELRKLSGERLISLLVNIAPQLGHPHL
jgi:hypothetical protein